MKSLIARASHKIVLHAAGCGSSALRELCIHPGSSSIVLEGNQFYSRGSLELALNTANRQYFAIEKFVSAATSERMAMRAFVRANAILVQQKEYEKLNASLGIGLTGQIGHHRTNQAFISIQSPQTIRTFHITFAPEFDAKEHREVHDTLISDYIFDAIQSFDDNISGCSSMNSNSNQTKGVNVALVSEKSVNIFDFLNTRDGFENVVIYKDLVKNSGEHKQGGHRFLFAVDQLLEDCVLFSGSFNPMHDAHIEIAKQAKELKNRQRGIFYEFALKNADKGEKDHASVLEIIQGILEKIQKNQEGETHTTKGVVLSNQPLFAEKTRFCRNSTFAVGSDTFKRILDCKYYGNSEENKIATLSTFSNANIDFVLAPRLNKVSDIVEKYKDFENNTPSFMKSKVIELEEFRNDVSSTDIRNQKKQQILNEEQLKESKQQ